MLTKSYTDAASPTTETLNGHKFTQVKASKSPGRKKETSAIKKELVTSKNSFEALSDNEEDLTGYMEVDMVDHVTPAKQEQKLRKMARKTKAQLKAAATAKAKARAAAQAHQINDLMDQTEAVVTPLKRPSNGHQREGTTPKGCSKDTEGDKETNNGKAATLCANCTEVCSKEMTVDTTTNLIYCSPSCQTKDLRPKLQVYPQQGTS